MTTPIFYNEWLSENQQKWMRHYKKLCSNDTLYFNLINNKTTNEEGMKEIIKRQDLKNTKFAQRFLSKATTGIIKDDVILPVPK